MIDDDALKITMTGLERGLHVGHIATLPLLGCCRDRTADDVCADVRFAGFDHIPVIDGDVVVGVLERESAPSGEHARDVMRRIDGSLIVSNDMPLSEFLPLMAETPYRLVVRGGRIEGIVTRSDTMKLPVRLYAFTLITHLEMVMARVIAERIPEPDDWKICADRRKRIRKEIEKRMADGLDPSPVEFTEFKEKTTIIESCLELDKDQIDELDDIRQLRNDIAHAKTFAGSTQQLRAFIRTLNLATDWIDALSSHDRLAPAAAEAAD